MISHFTKLHKHQFMKSHGKNPCEECFQPVGLAKTIQSILSMSTQPSSNKMGERDEGFPSQISILSSKMHEESPTKRFYPDENYTNPEKRERE